MQVETLKAESIEIEDSEAIKADSLINKEQSAVGRVKGVIQCQLYGWRYATACAFRYY